MTDFVMELLVVVAIGAPVLLLFISLTGVALFDWLRLYTVAETGAEAQSESHLPRRLIRRS